MNTYTKKNCYGHWESRTIIELQDSKQLTILTAKRSSGHLVTTVSVGTYERGFITHTVYQDYSASWISSHQKWITSKVVEDQHGSLDMMQIIIEVNKHYGIEG